MGGQKFFSKNGRFQGQSVTVRFKIRGGIFQWWGQGAKIYSILPCIYISFKQNTFTFLKKIPKNIALNDFIKNCENRVFLSHLDKVNF